MKEWILSQRDQTNVAWHEVPGKKKKDASSPVGTVDRGFLQTCHSPSLGLAESLTVFICFYQCRLPGAQPYQVRKHLTLIARDQEF